MATGTTANGLARRRRMINSAQQRSTTIARLARSARLVSAPAHRAGSSSRPARSSASPRAIVDPSSPTSTARVTAGARPAWFVPAHTNRSLNSPPSATARPPSSASVARASSHMIRPDCDVFVIAASAGTSTPTAKANSPSVVWSSSATTCQVTVYTPSSSSGRLARSRNRSLSGPTESRPTALPAPSRIAIVESAATLSVKSKMTSCGAVVRRVPGSGEERTRKVWAKTSPLTNAIVTKLMSAPIATRQNRLLTAASR